MTQTFTTSKGEFAGVLLPKDAFNMRVATNLFYDKKEPHSQLLSYALCIKLPPGTWQIIGLASDITEEQAKEMGFKKEIHYVDNKYITITNKESFHSLIQSLKMYSVNPYGKSFNDYSAKLPNVPSLEPYFDKWEEAEARTGAWIILRKL